jgi:TonB family protein
MKRRSPDVPLTFALCASLLVHALLAVLMLRDKIAALTGQLHRPPLVEALPDHREESEDTAPTPSIVDPPTTALADELAKPPALPLPPPEIVKPKPKDVSDENIEWGEKNAKGYAITSAPGKQPMAARQGVEDQSFASRDPEGAAREFPDQPSPSVVPPGQNGDGGKPLRDVLAGKGTEGNPIEILPQPNRPAVPPPPPPIQRIALASALDPAPAPQTSGPSFSQLPAPEQRSPAEPNFPPADRIGLANDAAYGESSQILPMKSPNVIGVRSREPMYPDVVQALTRPPGLKFDPRDTQPLPDPFAGLTLVPADITTAPGIQPATAALSLPMQQPEEMALLLGTADPRTAPPVVEAMLFPPGAAPREGGDAPLPELALADVVAAPEVRDAVIPLSAPPQPPDELAEKLEPTPILVARNGPTASAASATGGLPGPAVQAADPAPDTGLESDPFAKIPAVDFRNGKVEARSGRQVKPIRPQLSEAGRRDLLALQFPTVTYKVRIDKTGKVTDVSVVHSSGSEAIDMPVYRALWNWWFEPPHDKKGNPLEDIQLVTIHWG